MENKDLSKILSDVWDSLTDEQKEKARQCKTADELLALAGKEGIELPDEVANAVSGGYVFNENGSRGIEIIRDSDGEYLESADSWEQARKRAEELGQSTERIEGWTALNDLRYKSKKHCL